MIGFGDMNKIPCDTKKRRRAQAMVVVFVYLCIIFLVAINLHTYAQNMHRLVIRSLNHLRAMNAAEAGIVATLSHMSNSFFAGALDPSGPTFAFPKTAAMSSLKYPGMTPPCNVTVNVINNTGGNYTVRSRVSGWRIGTPEDVIMETKFPSPFGEYDTVVTRSGLWDYDGAGFSASLSGLSRLNNVTVDEALIIDRPGGGGLITGTGFQRIDLNKDSFPSMMIYGLRVQSIITMGAENPVLLGLPVKTVYNDIAESLPATGCEPADVVRVSGPDGMMMVRSDHAYDFRVAGIISESPRLLMGKRAGSLPLALNGVVKCKVVNENGPIQRGDLLVSSSRPGHAMRADPEEIKPGMLVGKAMQPFTEQTGVICVLVNKR